ncbi:hypothetical protein AVEN_115218-1 [Araneus ventricosus]|uniref:Uncharacterized protein n=1 Tax=Araneus ventricosus TaxID=182803 RepID=A0A4Y1ZXQ0_ARAVE|nr:hypothetical protein AVEN_115218-1 [Araneus ventricosus]
MFFRAGVVQKFEEGQPSDQASSSPVWCGSLERGTVSQGVVIAGVVRKLGEGGHQPRCRPRHVVAIQNYAGPIYGGVLMESGFEPGAPPKPLPYHWASTPLPCNCKFPGIRKSLSLTFGFRLLLELRHFFIKKYFCS